MRICHTPMAVCAASTISASTIFAGSPWCVSHIWLCILAIERVIQLSKPHIFLSHDWPASIEHHGNLGDLLRRKPFFRDDVKNGSLGSPPLFELLKTLKPDWWFSAHLHVKFEATYLHVGVAPHGLPSIGKNPDEIVIGDDDEEPTLSVDPKPSAINLNPDEITLDDEEQDVAPAPIAPPPRERTNFLALDKCIPGSKRQFLEVGARPWRA